MELLSPELGLFFWTLLSFLIVFFILKKVAWKPILKALHDRESGISESLAAADRVKKEMALMQNENERMIQEARAERSAILKEAKDMADTIVNKAKSDTKTIADKMVSDAQQQIHQQKMAAITEVKNQIGTLAVEVAEKVLRQSLSNDAAQNSYANRLAQEINLN